MRYLSDFKLSFFKIRKFLQIKKKFKFGAKHILSWYLWAAILKNYCHM